MRRRRPEKRVIAPDPIYGEVMVQKFINNIMGRGKKGVAERIFYGALDIVSSKTKGDSLEMFKKAVDNVKPFVEVKSRRIGGATYQVPIQVPTNRGFALATRWIIANAKARKGRSMAEKLAGEFIDAANEEGGSIKKKEDTHRMAEANKAFAHYS
ncbi:MAG TPA: 30S ribosomal protein S7 [Candidatus Marinimicrobia bacterium]|jgi:small subunit ribosomal protein S7|nr:30S ribosomal protein S7 [Candidatus Neomarinimicrobiota bacterium]HHZ99362.1 30S ribosomal protein S7 [Candidatus Neomarinimicrobiota bacterium]HIB02392.1 30S ribosomal protein S7 [Candidatus Neomarinimicrobiota bacterium]HIB70698.1 30S ribosomal protein S7 [Candidatus Neomarinimicrobiota bacterium]HIB96760.1 30S ribosomal protein S7 [Candidatus Neomarinimicrobiota bacterium]